jgi:hypothetical protein
MPAGNGHYVELDEKNHKIRETATSGVGHMPQNNATRGLGLISHQDGNSQMQQQQESIPPATQSTSRRENQTTTGVVYTQSSIHPAQSQFGATDIKERVCIAIDDSDEDEKDYPPK